MVVEIGKKKKEPEVVITCIKCGRPLADANDRVKPKLKCRTCKTVNKIILGPDGKLYQFPEVKKVK